LAISCADSAGVCYDSRFNCSGVCSCIEIKQKALKRVEGRCIQR